MAPPIAVPYCRTSTADKDQDPHRQLEIIRPWAEREGVTLLEPVIDEGTSASKTNPLDREKFVLACERAKAAGATAIVVECSDRFSRQGAKLDAWTEVEVERRFGLAVWRADKPLSHHGTMLGAVGDAMHAEGAKAWVQEHASKVRSGMARKKAAGSRFGRKRKELSPGELRRAQELRAQGLGWRRVAREINRSRGALELTDRQARVRAAVSHTLVRRVVEPLRNANRNESAEIGLSDAVAE